MNKPAVSALEPLGFPWKGVDPFLICSYHNDTYPAGNDRLGPAASLEGRQIGEDFTGRDGWRMYHGRIVPGFPRHPHRGFETVTIVRRGYVDHSDSLGATARFGAGDVQWITAGRGIVHSEMFPLLERDRSNPLELFQIWLNLPSKDKMADPYFKMLWSDQIPHVRLEDEHARVTEIMLIAGSIDGFNLTTPPPHSWAAEAKNEVAIWMLKYAAGARFTLPAAAPGINRALYFFAGESATISGTAVPARTAVQLRSDVPAVIENGGTESEMLLLQGRPIGEPVVQHGPFVMNSQLEIQQALHDYQRSEFGGWPWPKDEHVHAPNVGRHARYIDGRIA
jgi:quercetin 2,3-dioxygenase